MELEWKWNGTFPTKKFYAKKEWKWNGNGMVMEWKINGQPQWKKKIDGMEQKRKGNGMERLRPTMILTIFFGNVMEWNWKRNGI